MNLDADDIDRMEKLDIGLMRRRIAALKALPIARGSAEWHLVAVIGRLPDASLSPDDHHAIASLSWAWRRRHLPAPLAPKVDPNDPLSPDRLAVEMGCTPTVAQARAELRT